MSEKQSKGISGIKGGKRAGAGRKKGVPNKRTAKVQAAVEASGITPLDFMLRIMRTEPGEIEDERVLQSVMELRFEAAKAAAPYVHARLAAVEMKHSGKIRTVTELSDADLAAIASSSGL